MSLKKGRSRAIVSRNIKMLVDEWKVEGHIGYSHPRGTKLAIRQAVAIALRKAGKTRNRKSSAAR